MSRTSPTGAPTASLPVFRDPPKRTRSHDDDEVEEESVPWDGMEDTSMSCFFGGCIPNPDFSALFEAAAADDARQSQARIVEDRDA